MAHAAIDGKVMSAAATVWEVGMQSGLASASLTEAVASSLAPLLVGACHGAAWQREMWRLALDHGETWVVRDIAVPNEAVRAYLLARYDKMPPPFPPPTDSSPLRSPPISFPAQ